MVLTLALAAVALTAVPAGATVGSTAMFRVGRQQLVFGPSTNVDSLYVTVRSHGLLYAFLSNNTTVMYRQLANGKLVNGRVILHSGPYGSIDACGVHLVGKIINAGHGHWVGFYHAERADPHQYGGHCTEPHKGRNHTRWSIVQVSSYDGGKTWVKGHQVITQDRTLMYVPRPDRTRSGDTWAYKTDDAGSPRLIVRGDWMYMFYRAAIVPDGRQHMTVARAPLASLGRPGAWRKWYHGSFSQPGLGGHQSSLAGLPTTARGVSWNTYLHAYISVHVWTTGIDLYESAGSDFTDWRQVAQLTGRVSTGDAWHQACTVGHSPSFPATESYGATIGLHGDSSSTGRRFWIYYMYKPKGSCFSQRRLVRREVAIATPLVHYPSI